MFDFSKFFKSIKYAKDGMTFALKEEQNLRIEVLIFILVLLLGLFLKISSDEWLEVIAVSLLVIIIELMNTAIEKLTDLVSDKRKNSLAKQAKDAGATAVLLTCLVAVVVGIKVFLPKLLGLFESF